MVPGLGVEPRRARGPRDFKATGKRQRTKGLANSLPFPVSEESEEGRRVRGLWTPRWTPVAGDVEGGRARLRLLYRFIAHLKDEFREGGQAGAAGVDAPGSDPGRHRSVGAWYLWQSLGATLAPREV